MTFLAQRPLLAARYRATGKLPRVIRPRSPLIELLEQIAPQHRHAILGLNVGPSLGYAGRRNFYNAEHALRWLKPHDEMIDGEPWPAESFRMRDFRGPLCLDDLVAAATKVPAGFADRYVHLNFCRPRAAATIDVRRQPPLAPGQRLRLIAMPSDPCPIPAGTTGTVRSATPLDGHHPGRWQISVAWDTPRSLMLVVPPDSYELLPAPVTP